MTTPTPCGSWTSPISAEMLATGSIRLGAPKQRGDACCWLELRPTEKGRSVLVERGADGSTRDLNAAPFNARTRVHEYGGGSYLLGEGEVFFSNFADQLLYQLVDGGEPRAITAEGYRYADGVLDAAKRRIYLVEEDHTGAGEPVNRLVRLDLADDGPAARHVIAEGHDFYASPRLSPCGTRLAWINWDHPNMPWDHTELWIAHLNFAGFVELSERVSGHEGESAGEPVWSEDRVLYYTSDRSGYWNLYRWEGKPVPLCPRDAEFSKPHWTFGNGSFAFAGPGRLVCSFTRHGVWRLGLLDLASLALRDLELPYTQIDYVSASETHALFCGASPTEMGAVVRLDLSSGELEVLKRSAEIPVDPAYVSPAEPIEFPTEDGLTAHALYYPPKSPDHTIPAGEKPPLVVFSHGGPTGATSGALRLGTQYWTSRGIAVVDVNYGGSSGYGRDYRNRLKDRWGIVDVDDCVNAARYLCAKGLADPKRLAIRGGSAGGYTTLCALTFRDVFQAGCSLFGVSDLEALAKDTHKFESRYLDGLIGPYPERRDLYEKRSPIHHTEGLSCGVILLQGLEDAVVPPNQAEMMRDALRAKGLPVAYVPFEGEQHGFRQAENIQRAQEAELYFYAKVLGFELAEDIPPLEIENL